MKSEATESSWLERLGLALVFAIPTALVLLFIMAIITAVLVGPWGAALDRVAEAERLRFDRLASAVLFPMVILGSLIIGWSMAGRRIERKNREQRLRRDLRRGLSSRTRHAEQSLAAESR